MSAQHCRGAVTPIFRADGALELDPQRRAIGVMTDAAPDPLALRL